MHGQKKNKKSVSGEQYLFETKLCSLACNTYFCGKYKEVVVELFLMFVYYTYACCA